MGDEYVDYVRVYTDKAGEWRWTAYSNNGRKLADSGEGFKSESYCLAAVEQAFPLTRVVADQDSD